MNNQENNKDNNYITIDQYLRGDSQSKMKQIQFYSFRGNNKTGWDKAVLLIGADYISYTEYSGNEPRISPVILNSKDCLIFLNRDNKTVSIKLQQNQENSNPVLTFAYTKKDVLFDSNSVNKKGDNSNTTPTTSSTTTNIEYGGEGGTPGMKEK